MRDEFSVEVKRIISARAGGHCSNPRCTAQTGGPHEDSSKALNIGVAAHIAAAAAGGPRFDSAMTPEQRSHADNAIWLCQNCAKLIDNDVINFPASVLQAWKTLAEHEAFTSIGRTRLPAVETEHERKLREIIKWKDKHVTLTQMNTGRAVMISGPKAGSSYVKLFDCNEFTVTIGQEPQHLQEGWRRSIPLSNIEISYDDRHQWLELQERYS